MDEESAHSNADLTERQHDVFLRIAGIDRAEDLAHVTEILSTALAEEGLRGAVSISHWKSEQTREVELQSAPATFWPLLKLERLAKLYRRGNLSVGEFTEAKTILLKHM